jgi:hypothetical protein
LSVQVSTIIPIEILFVTHGCRPHHYVLYYIPFSRSAGRHRAGWCFQMLTIRKSVWSRRERVMSWQRSMLHANETLFARCIAGDECDILLRDKRTRWCQTCLCLLPSDKCCCPPPTCALQHRCNRVVDDAKRFRFCRLPQILDQQMPTATSVNITCESFDCNMKQCRCSVQVSERHPG